jgi:hypothetical protein
VNEKLVEEALARLTGLRNEAKEPWERAVVDAGLSVLARGGTEAVNQLVSLVERKDAAQLIAISLPLRESSDILAALQNGEADRVGRTKELLEKVWAVAKIVAEELLKIALGSAA